ncbi:MULTISPECIES: hypothetical protein [Sphingobacterium]|uniref:hypothetical protein n=1 Tax=Sphingobacterium TaxID=28453 RepID=UPI0013DC977F|nr:MULTISPECIES: hypothetical protein [unclassified Sphingobacterium]
MKRTQFFRNALALTAMATLMFSFNTKSEINTISPDQPVTVAVIPCGYEYAVLGNIGSPRTPSSFGNVYVTLGTTSATQSTTSSTSAQLIFTDRVNSFVTTNVGFELRKLDNTDICDVTATDWTGASTITAPAGNNVWYTYVGQTATSIPGVVMLVRNALGEIWAFTLESATAATITTSPLTIQGTNTINVRKL